MRLQFLRLALLVSSICLSCEALLAGQKKIVPVAFVDTTQRSGLALGLQRSFAAAAGDYNKDGLQDLFISHHGPKTTLWKNNGNGTFSDKTSIIEDIKADKHGASFIDLNGDGFLDIAISVGAKRGRGTGKNFFLYNNKGESFSQAQGPNPLIEYEQGRGRSIVPVDVNHDENIDLFFFNLIGQKTDPPHRLVVNKGSFTDNIEDSELPLGEELSLSEAHGCTVVDLDKSGPSAFILTGPGRDAGRIFQQQQSSFVDVTQSLGISPEGCMSATPVDYDNDGDLDLFYGRGLPPPSSTIAVSEGKIKFNLYFAGQTMLGFNSPVKKGKVKIDIRFEQSKTTKHLHLGGEKAYLDQNSLELIDLADPRLQGEPTIDLGKDIGGFLWRDAKRGTLQYRFIADNTVQETEGVIEPIGFAFTSIEGINIAPETASKYRNSLYRNDNGHFTDVATAAGISGGGQSYTSTAADFNNDGLQDIYVVNIGQSFDALNPPNHLFVNHGNGTFSETAMQSDATGPATGIGSGVIAFDYDNDGKIDIFLHNGNVQFPIDTGPLMLLRNTTDTGNRSLMITLDGAHERQGWGAKILAISKNSRLLQQKIALNGYLSASDLPIHIGLGNQKELATLQIEWPSGKRQSFSHIKRSKMTIVEPH